MDLGAIIELMADHWRRGSKVVRLHTGDPAIYGAIREQMARLDKLAIPYLVVPGVSSIFAASAALQAELTLPEVSQTVIICRRAGRTPVPEKENLRLLAEHRATMMILLSVGMIDQVVADLLAGGYGAETPVAVIEKASWPEQKIIRSTLIDIAGKIRKAGITKTAIIAVGEVFRDIGPAAFSKLYDAEFSHGCRNKSSGAC
jgi:precorrin-4/cobalt-precorrin-4 C11-methyltransferase